MKNKLNWRLPTKDELVLIYTNLHRNGLAGFTDGHYWSSEESNVVSAWAQYFFETTQFTRSKLKYGRIRSVCAFHSKAGGDLYKIGEEITRGFVFDIKGDMIFICKKEDESDLMTWDEAMEKFGGKK